MNRTSISVAAVLAAGIVPWLPGHAQRPAGTSLVEPAPAYLALNGPVGADGQGPSRPGTPETVVADEGDPQVNDHLFDGTEKFAAKAKESNEVNLDKNMLGMAGSKGGEKGDLAKKLDFVVVRNYEYANEGDYNMADLALYFKKLDNGGWKHLVRTRSAKESTDICVKQDSEGVTREMVIISAEPKELNFVHLKGNVSVADMKNFGGMMNGKGDSEPKLQKR